MDDHRTFKRRREDDYYEQPMDIMKGGHHREYEDEEDAGEYVEDEASYRKRQEDDAIYRKKQEERLFFGKKEMLFHLLGRYKQKTHLTEFVKRRAQTLRLPRGSPIHIHQCEDCKNRQAKREHNVLFKRSGMPRDFLLQYELCGDCLEKNMQLARQFDRNFPEVELSGSQNAKTPTSGNIDEDCSTFEDRKLLVSL